MTAGLAIYDTVSVSMYVYIGSSLTYIGVDAICIVPYSHVLRRTSVFNGFPAPRCRRER